MGMDGTDPAKEEKAKMKSEAQLAGADESRFAALLVQKRNNAQGEVEKKVKMVRFWLDFFGSFAAKRLSSNLFQPLSSNCCDGRRC